MASLTSVLSRLSYPKQPGDQPWSLIDVRGPTSYVLGGQIITAAAFGLQSLDFVIGTASNNAAAYVVPILLPFNPGDSSPSVSLVWMSVVTGGQMVAGTNLSALTVRALAIGR